MTILAIAVQFECHPNVQEGVGRDSVPRGIEKLFIFGSFTTGVRVDVIDVAFTNS